MVQNMPQPRVLEQSSFVEFSTTAPGEQPYSGWEGRGTARGAEPGFTEDYGEDADAFESDSSDSLGAGPVSRGGSRSGHTPSSSAPTTQGSPASDRVTKPYPRYPQQKYRSGSSSGGSERPKARTDVAHCAPAQMPVLKTALPQLPDFVTEGSVAPTSYNISQVQREMEFSIGALVSEKVRFGVD